MRAAIYVRVSTDEQAAEGYSLGAQKQILEDRCIAEDWEPVGIYEDDGYSGRNANRPAYQKMMDEMDTWDVLLVLKMDRIHRNSRNFMTMMETLDKHGKEFMSCTESLDTSNALGRFVVDMIQRIAQLESEQIGERTYVGMREKAESMGTNKHSEKKTMGFTPPFGYHLDKGSLIEDIDELEIVSKIFDMYLDNETIDSICYILNKNGFSTRRGNPWNKYNVRNILHNPIYAGYMKWDDILIPHDAKVVVNIEDFDTVQDIMESKTNGESRYKLRLNRIQ